MVGKLVDLLAGVGRGSALGNYRANASARFYRACKYGELYALYSLGDILYLHAEAGVGLVRAVAIHSVGKGYARQGRRYILAQHLLADVLQEALAHLNKSVNVYKRHLEVYLGKFGLAVGAQVFVAEAAGYLNIAVVARYHQKLLVYLRRLRQGVKAALVHARGHEVVARALGSRAHHHRRFYLKEAV